MPGSTTNQLERLAEGEARGCPDPQLAARPQPLVRADLEGAGMPDRPACDFSKNGHMLFAAHGGDAIARIDGRLYHFSHSSPVGPTGGFFEDRQLSISIGRVAEIDRPRRRAAGRRG